MMTLRLGKCKHHGIIKFVIFKKKPIEKYGCWKCKSLKRRKYYQRKKQKLVKDAGGKCGGCGYDKYIGSLDFHHVDPSQKSFELSDSKYGYAKSKEEAKKCILLCKNCHAEIEAGLSRIVSIQIKNEVDEVCVLFVVKKQFEDVDVCEEIQDAQMDMSGIFA